MSCFTCNISCTYVCALVMHTEECTELSCVELAPAHPKSCEKVIKASMCNYVSPILDHPKHN